MNYTHIVPGRFLSRPNRFLAHVEINGTEEICHVKNTGRCRELLQPGCTVWCQHHDDPKRKTAWSLICAQKDTRLINLDSQAPNLAAREFLCSGGLGFLPTYVKSEAVFDNSRFDLYYEIGTQKGFIEVKGVTLEYNGIVRFPDAPTERGQKHLYELIEAKKKGYDAAILFVVQMTDVQYLEPNDRTDPDFGQALRLAAQNGVQILAYSCLVTPEIMVLDRKIPVKL